MNKVYLKGFAGQDATAKTSTINGREFATFSVATSEFRGKNEKNEDIYHTEWHNILAGGYCFEAAQKIKKGDKVFVEGKLQTTATDLGGTKKYYTSIVASAVDKIAYDKKTGADFVSQDPYENSVPF